MSGIDLLYKIFFASLLTIFMLTVATFAMQLSDRNSFTTYVNHTIERHGGLTEDALSDIEAYSLEHFNNRFTVLTSTNKMPYGTKIHYTYQVKVLPVFMDLQVAAFTLESESTSKVR